MSEAENLQRHINELRKKGGGSTIQPVYVIQDLIDQLKLANNSIVTLESIIDELRQKLESAEVETSKYKEELYQLRQKAENWSTKLGFITSVINSRKIIVSDKEQEFPHLLIERLHTDATIYQQKLERNNEIIREAREQDHKALLFNSDNGTSVSFSTVEYDRMPDYAKAQIDSASPIKLYAHPPIPADHSEDK